MINEKVKGGFIFRKDGKSIRGNKIKVIKGGKTFDVLEAYCNGVKAFDEILWLIKNGKKRTGVVFYTSPEMTASIKELSDRISITASMSYTGNSTYPNYFSVKFPATCFPSGYGFGTKDPYYILFRGKLSLLSHSTDVASCELRWIGRNMYDVSTDNTITSTSASLLSTHTSNNRLVEKARNTGYAPKELSTTMQFDISTTNETSGTKKIEWKLEIYDFCLMPQDLYEKYGYPWDKQ